MKIFKYIMLGVLFCSTVAIGQTKMIAFKSHSGNMKNFSAALLNPKMDLAPHNLGMAPNPIVRTAQLDSLIFISDSVAVMVTSEYCQKNDWYYRGDTTADLNKKEFWKAGKDTVINHPLFSHQHSLDSIKNEMGNYYYWKNEMDSTVFIGYDNGDPNFIDKDKDAQNDNDQNAAPFVSVPQNPGSGGLLLMIIAIVCISLFIGFTSWMFAKKSKSAVVSA